MEKCCLWFHRSYCALCAQRPPSTGPAPQTSFVRLEENATCGLCQHHQCTLAHILTGCETALQQKRHTWRHDSVLRQLEFALLQQLRQGTPLRPIPNLARSFLKPGSRPKAAPLHRSPHLLDAAADWALLADYDSNRIVFPPEICATQERPDITIWSRSAKTVLLIELTCPLEENISAAHAHKIARYTELAEMCRLQGWSVHMLPVEVGARGFVGRSVATCLKHCGFPSRDIQRTVRRLSMLAETDSP